MAEKQTKVGGTIAKRDIAVAVILSIVTCGIYGIYWFIVLSEDVNTLTDDHTTSGALAFILSLITCGIYGIYWVYNIGKRMVEYEKAHGAKDADESIVILYVVLQLFGWGIVTYALIQDKLNKYAA